MLDHHRTAKDSITTVTVLLCCGFVVAMIGVHAVTTVRAQNARAPKPQAPEEAPLSWTCPMHLDVVEDRPGQCPICRMALEPVRLVSIYTCPVHIGVVTKDTPGKCPVDHRALVPMTMAVIWICPGTPTKAINPGKCADGSSMARAYEQRPHGNHNPQHGGQFFMAPDNWHHVEGAYVAPDIFRLYLYDDFTKPLAMAKVHETTGRLTITNSGKEVLLSRNGRFLQARIGKLAFPTTMQARVKFQAEAPEHVFDFSFETYSKDAPVAMPVMTMATPGTLPAPLAVSASTTESSPSPFPSASTGSGTGAGTPAPSAALSPVDRAPIAATVPELLAQLRARNNEIKALIDRGQFGSIYVPAFQAKDVALAVDAHGRELGGEQPILEAAVNRLVRHAYLLDAFGDLGNKQQILEAYSRFSSALEDVESVFSKPTAR
jgi:hypothetical protein